MCGRAAQTLQAAKHGAEMVAAPLGNIAGNFPDEAGEGDVESSEHNKNNNYNMSPGMDALVIWNEGGKLKTGRKVWGLVSKGGTSKNPLPADDTKRMSLHFQNLQYNARSDTLYSKPTFSRLVTQSKTCLVPLTGYFEWKASPLGGKKGRKQPYFVFRKGAGSTCLLVAGLWTQVATGLPEMPTLDTFTILTTEANKQISWLHHRMPVCIWDMTLACKWLEAPSPAMLKLIDEAARQNNDGFAWHMVTQDMSSLKCRGNEAIRALAAPRSVSSFFKKPQSPEQTAKADVPGTSNIGEIECAPAQDSKKRKRTNDSKLQKCNVPKQTTKIVTTSPQKPNTRTKRNTVTTESGGNLITSFFRKKN